MSRLIASVVAKNYPSNVGLEPTKLKLRRRVSCRGSSRAPRAESRGPQGPDRMIQGGVELRFEKAPAGLNN